MRIRHDSPRRILAPMPLRGTGCVPGLPIVPHADPLEGLLWEKTGGAGSAPALDTDFRGNQASRP